MLPYRNPGYKPSDDAYQDVLDAPEHRVAERSRDGASERHDDGRRTWRAPYDSTMFRSHVRSVSTRLTRLDYSNP